MEQDRDALLESYALRAPEALDGLIPEERYQVYQMLRLRAAVRIGGTLEVGGMFGEGSGFCHSKTRSWARFESTKRHMLRFRALLTDGAREVRFERAVIS
jgi:hypothetical protein